MSRGTFLKLFVSCLVLAFFFSLLSLFFMNSYSESYMDRHRNEFMGLLADSLERRAQNLTNEQVKSLSLFPRGGFFDRPPMGGNMNGPMGGPPPGMPPGPPPEDFMGHDGPPPGMPGLPPGPPPDEFGGPPPPPGTGGPGRVRHDNHIPPFAANSWWVITETREVLLNSSGAPLPVLPALPEEYHQITSGQNFFRLFPGVYVVKLERTPALYLVARDSRPPFSAPMLMFQTFFTFGTIVAALGFALAFMFWYLRKKSDEARVVLQRLERGDLKARFEVKKIDQFGGLLLDFNRMAGEIEKLVMRIHEVERTRKDLLQELGHDLRTPLTSLKTSVETLQNHYRELSPEDFQDLVKLINSEVEYFKGLIEKLMTIASLDDPHYKKTNEVISLFDLLDRELLSRQRGGGTLKWTLACDSEDFKSYRIMGDEHLISRMVRNALDNSSRFAKTEIQVCLKKNAREIEILVRDDGPGVDATGLQSFGKRREFKGRSTGVGGTHLSLGLGSVIMRTIAELHGGKVDIENNSDVGACVRFSLPRLES